MTRRKPTKQGGQGLSGLEELGGGDGIVLGGVNVDVRKGLADSVKPGSHLGSRKQLGKKAKAKSSVTASCQLSLTAATQAPPTCKQCKLQAIMFPPFAFDVIGSRYTEILDRAMHFSPTYLVDLSTA